MNGKDYYQTLGVPRNAADKDVKAAFRRLARRYHPDVNPGNKTAEAKFKEINEAYEVLSDPEKRRKYDEFGEQWQYADRFQETARQQPQWGGGRAADSDTGGEDLFDSLFRHMGAGGFRRHGHAATAVETPVEVTLEEAFAGTTRFLNLSDGHSPHRLEVKIPPGVDNGSRVRVSTPGGEVHLVVTVKPHSLFQREGSDLKTEVAVPLVTVVLGGEVQVPTLKGKVALKIPPETQNGTVFRLAGMGMPSLGSSQKGVLLAKVQVVLPSRLTDREKELFRQLESLRTD
ncbi:MAG: J domain-containing protein [Chloroflexi bacterium]|nr:J domain-containing protein [Chloroflexota bacterium]